MSGFHRQGMPASLDRAAITAVVRLAVAEEIAFIARAVDPFGIDIDCLAGRRTHEFIASCGEIVCVHCSKVAWA